MPGRRSSSAPVDSFIDGDRDLGAPRFRRGFFGYRPAVVDETVARLQQRVEGLEQQSVDMTEQLLETQQEASETRHDLTRARAELRYWNDRASYVDSEVARARHRAADLEQAARDRADTIEADAQERSLQLIDRVCSEANVMLQSAREEAREMFLRFETDVDLSKQRLDKLEKVRAEVAQTMQAALVQFEDAVRQLDKVGPIQRIVEALEEPERRARPTFGTEKALEAARRFEESVDSSATAALSTPLAPVDADSRERTEDTDSAKEPAAPAEQSEPNAQPAGADGAFAALLATTARP